MVLILLQCNNLVQWMNDMIALILLACDIENFTIKVIAMSTLTLGCCMPSGPCIEMRQTTFAHVSYITIILLGSYIAVYAAMILIHYYKNKFCSQ